MQEIQTEANICSICLVSSSVNMSLGEMREINSSTFSVCRYTENNMCIPCGTQNFTRPNTCGTQNFMRSYTCLSCCHRPLTDDEVTRICRSMHKLENISDEIIADHEGNALKCPHCNAPCINQRTLQQHIQEKCREVDVEQTCCGFCGTNYKMFDARIFGYSTIEETLHNMSLFNSGISKSMTIRYILYHHMRVCGQPTVCEHCNQDIEQLINLPRDTNVKIQHERFVCPALGKCKDCENRGHSSCSYSGKNGLSVHKLNECPRKCKICKIELQGQADLDFHKNNKLCLEKITVQRPKRPTKWDSVIRNLRENTCVG